LGGPMKTADGICGVVEDGLRTWGLRGPDAATPGKAVDPNRQQQPPVPRKKTAKGKHRLTSPAQSPSPRHGATAAQGHGEASHPHNVEAMFLSKLNPLTRGLGDKRLREDPLVRDDLRSGLWTEGRAVRQSLLL